MTHTVTVASGLFAPGHLGELTQVLPFELIDDVLERTRTVQRRLRLVPSRVGMYFVLAMCLFPEAGYLHVWSRLVAGVRVVVSKVPSEKALREVRRRLGTAPFQELFEVVSGPLARPATPGVSYRRWRTVAFDGCSSLQAPDILRVRGVLGKTRRHRGIEGYPHVRLMALCETGTRGLLGAVFGPTSTGEPGYARQLLPLLDGSMLLLADRNFSGDEFLNDVADTGAQLLARLTYRGRPAVISVLPDGSYLTRLRGRTFGSSRPT
ncbi:transposase domain-containing protein [Streptomyces sp. NPDC057908]|uniref:transposase domain-containing protein n=1 Tax=Streptomyces sp. NPDC057908 TaxID=3346276 RepID=UPI0036E5DA12